MLLLINSLPELLYLSYLAKTFSLKFSHTFQGVFMQRFVPSTCHAVFLFYSLPFSHSLLLLFAFCFLASTNTMSINSSGVYKLLSAKRTFQLCVKFYKIQPASNTCASYTLYLLRCLLCILLTGGPLTEMLKYNQYLMLKVMLSEVRLFFHTTTFKMVISKTFKNQLYVNAMQNLAVNAVSEDHM